MDPVESELADVRRWDADVTKDGGKRKGEKLPYTGKKTLEEQC